MNGKRFLDTNVLVYTFDDSSREKQATAKALVKSALADGDGAISFQVVGEFMHLAGSKFTKPLPATDLRRYLRTVLVPMCEVYWSPELAEQTLSIREQTGYSFWDSQILAAAVVAGCETLYTEDLQHGRTVAGVRIVNPFLKR
jgi:predicted nucleic acid-binding protein